MSGTRMRSIGVRTVVIGVGCAVPGIAPGALAQSFGVKQAWVARYDGPGSYWEELHDMALGDGCVYVTGFSYKSFITTEFATVKYDSSGREEWVRRYGRGRANEAASGEAIAVDGAGNVVVTGRSADYVSGPPEKIIVDAATLKYDGAGNLLWEHAYRSAGENNQPLDVAVDGDGNVYVAGASWVGPGFDLMLLKYSPDGVLLWDRTIGKRDERWDAGYSVAIGPDGNPVVGGYTEFDTFGTFSFGYLVKYSAEGDLLWEREHESWNTASAWWRVVINEAGRIYAFGEIAPPGDLYHIWTSQYSPNGTLLWDRHYDGSANASNFRGGIALTPSGGVVVCGVSWDFDGGGVTNIVTLRYEADGTEAWRRLERGGYAQAGGRDVAIDTFGNAYVAGWGFDTNENMDFVTLKYTPDGELAWTQIFAGEAGFTDWPARIAVDDAQNVFVAGDANDGLGTYIDYATIRYNQAGTLRPRR